MVFLGNVVFTFCISVSSAPCLYLVIHSYMNDEITKPARIYIYLWVLEKENSLQFGKVKIRKP